MWARQSEGTAGAPIGCGAPAKDEPLDADSGHGPQDADGPAQVVVAVRKRGFHRLRHRLQTRKVDDSLYAVRS